ncbi:MAG: hypothetical protein V4702_00030 [Patescibacteria group bacterium]
MKKIIIAGLVVLVAVAGGVMLMNGGKDKNKTTNQAPSTATNTNDTTTESQKTACKLLTLEDAKGLLGDNAVLVDGSGGANAATTEDVKLDNCTYSSDGATLGDLKQLTIQVQSGNSDQVQRAYENYEKEFPGTSLSELGDEAYYATEAKQVNVMKNGNWLLVFGGSINAGDDANKELNLKAAKLALEKL